MGPPHHRNQAGFSMVEVLVAIVILSIGVLGAVGLQASALQANKEVRYQVVAVTLAKELTEKLRGNHAIAIKPAAADNPYISDTTLSAAPSAPSTNCFTTGCANDALAVARWDMYDWQQRLFGALPSPRIRICMDAAPYDSAGVPKWDCSNSGDALVLKLAWNSSDTQGELVFSSAAASRPLVVLPLTAGSSE
jgi:type IV pilus assembly protein PilV